MRRRAAAVGAAAGLALSTVAMVLGGVLPPGTPDWVGPALLGVAWLGFALGVAFVPHTSHRSGVVLVVLGAVALLFAAGLGPPRSSDDLYRYQWDGRVQAAGFDPYRYAPSAPELAGLRDGYLWPERSNWCVSPGAVDVETGEALLPGCTLINRPTVHTIYPPGAQLMFHGLHRLSPTGTGSWPVRVMAGLAALATTLLLMLGLRRLGYDPRRAVLWAWCPLVAFETASNGHIDVAAAFLTTAALLVVAVDGVRRQWWGGLLLGLAVITKLTPLAVVPSVARIRVLVALSTVVGLAYLPYVVLGGAQALGYLGGYAAEEGYTDGSRFALLPVPGPVAPWLAAVLAAIIAVGAWRRAATRRPWNAAALSTGGLLLVATPSYPWYALLLVALVALGARVEWLAVAAAGYVAQYGDRFGLSHPLAHRIGYGLAVIAVVAGWWWRRRGLAARAVLVRDGS
jgi:glycosyl transferase family 87